MWTYILECVLICYTPAIGYHLYIRYIIRHTSMVFRINISYRIGVETIGWVGLSELKTKKLGKAYLSTTTEAKYSPATRKSPDSSKTVLDSILNWSDVNVNKKKHQNSEYCCSQNRLRNQQIFRPKNDVRPKFENSTLSRNKVCNLPISVFSDYFDFCALYTVFSYSLVLSQRFF